MKTEDKKDLAFYLNLPYTIILRRDEEGDCIARIAELEGCTAHGPSESEAIENLNDVKRAWIEDALETGDEIPQPEPEGELPSGKWVQRVPRSLHKKLIELAKKEETSLNQLVTSLLAEAVGIRRKEGLVALSGPIVASHEPARTLRVWFSEHACQADWTVVQKPLPRDILFAEAIMTAAVGNNIQDRLQMRTKGATKEKFAQAACI